MKPTCLIQIITCGKNARAAFWNQIMLMAVFFLSGLTVRAQLVDGSFEQPMVANFQTIVAGATNLSPWVVTQQSIDLASTNNGFILGAAYDGGQYIDLDGSPGSGQIIQTFGTSGGQIYYLSFAYANNYVNQPSASMTVRVYDADGNNFGPLTVTHSNSIPGSLNWTFYETTFLGSGKSNTVEFTSLSGTGSFGGILLDAVSLATVPPTNAPTAVFILPPQLSGGNLNFSFQTVSNQSYTIQQNSDLLTTNWTYFTNTIGDGNLYQCIVPLAGKPKKFFRVRQP